MSKGIYLSNAECRQHFRTIGTTGRGASTISMKGLTEIPMEVVPSRVGPWDAIDECIIELDWVTDLTLSRSQMRSLLQHTGLMDKIVEFGEVETQIRENLADELSEGLIGKGWPTNGDIRNGLDFDQFVDEFQRAAEASGYLRSRPHVDGKGFVI